MKNLTADDVLDFQKPGRRCLPDYLVLENGDFVFLDDEDIATGTPLAFNYVTTVQGTEARILLSQNAITADDGWHAELDADGRISADKAAEIADGINETSDAALAMAVERVNELTAAAERAAAEAQAASLARAAAVARVVNLCGGNKRGGGLDEAARVLKLDKSRVSRLTGKMAAAADAIRQAAAAAETATAAMATVPDDAFAAVAAAAAFPEPAELGGGDVTPEPAPR